MNVLNKHGKLVEMIQQSDLKKRTTAYSAIGFIAANAYIAANEGSKLNDAKIFAKQLVYDINELAIVDKDALYQSIAAMLGFKYDNIRDNSSNVGGASDLDDILGLGKYFSKSAEEAINANMDVFKTTAIYFKTWLQEQQED